MFFSSVGSTSSSPALLGIREPRSEYDRTQTSMQYYNNQGDVITHKDMYTGKLPVRQTLIKILLRCTLFTEPILCIWKCPVYLNEKI